MPQMIVHVIQVYKHKIISKSVKRYLEKLTVNINK